MRIGAFRALLLLVAAVVTGSCSDPTDPPPVQGPSPFVAQAGGLWAGTANLVSVTSLFASNLGCLGTDVTGRILSGVLPQDTVALAFTQDGTTITDAQYSSSGTGLACKATKGTAALNSVVVQWESCGGDLVVRCNAEPSVTLQPVGSTLFATIVGGNLVGTVTNSYTESNTVQQPGSSFIVKYTVDLTRR